jgi:hypothetical protein
MQANNKLDATTSFRLIEEKRRRSRTGSVTSLRRHWKEGREPAECDQTIIENRSPYEHAF